jgi:hypothetical protein
VVVKRLLAVKSGTWLIDRLVSELKLTEPPRQVSCVVPEAQSVERSACALRFGSTKAANEVVARFVVIHV